MCPGFSDVLETTKSFFESFCKSNLVSYTIHQGELWLTPESKLTRVSAPISSGGGYINKGAMYYMTHTSQGW